MNCCIESTCMITKFQDQNLGKITGQRPMIIQRLGASRVAEYAKPMFQIERLQYLYLVVLHVYVSQDLIPQ